MFTITKINVVTLCGSAKFKKEFRKVESQLTLAGNAVLSLAFFNLKDGERITETQLRRLKDIHFKKIDLADSVFIMNVDGYIGESTKREISYAKKQNKEIQYYQDV